MARIPINNELNKHSVKKENKVAEINESRRVKIKDRRITLQDIQKLSLFVVSEYEELKARCDYTKVSFSAICDDMSTFESSSPDIFDSTSIIATKRVKRIEIACSSLRPDNALKISIAHGDSYGYYDSEISVSGSDSKWVNGILRRMEEIIEYFLPQYNWIKKHSVPLHAISAISLGSILIHILIMFTPETHNSVTSQESNSLINFVKAYPFMRYPVVYLIYFFFGIFPARAMMDRLSTLWPSIELQIGPEHRLLEKQRRKWLVAGITLGGIPMLVQLGYDVMKYFATK